MSVANVTLPSYTKKEEILNGVSHGIGIVFGFISLIFCISKAESVSAIIGSTVFSLCVCVLYLFSTLYHSISMEKIKKVFRLIDHSAIYILISGTIIALCFIIFYDKSLLLVVIPMVLCIALSALGITLTFIDHEKYKKVQMILYMVIGWGAAILAYPLYKYCDEPIKVIGFVLAGGIAYTVGTIFYAIGKKKRYFHSIFHVFVLAGTVLHFMGIYYAL